MANHKKYVPLLSLMILSSSLSFSSQNYSKTELFGIAAALTATAGAIWYACQPYSYEQLNQQVSDLEDKSDSFIESLNNPARFYELANSHAALKSLQEQDLYTCTGISGIADGTFHNTCRRLINKANCVIGRISKAITYQKDSEIIFCLTIRQTTAKDIRDGLLYIDTLFTYHKPYFELHNLTKKLSLQYSQELTALTYSYEQVRSLYSFKRVNQLAADFNRLNIMLSDEATRRYPILRSEAEYLSYDLSCICNHMISDPRYALDLYNEQLAEELRLERLRNQMLRHQMYHSYQEPTTHVYVDIQYTTKPTPAKKNKQQETPIAPTQTATPPASTPVSETKSEKPATLDTSSTSIFDPQYSHGAADL